ncbi:hypothetical protein CEXT_213771 [Caerostris extrusa]|uniref:Uncharacterized protein n=1 Tax=Caerostris extrusa TaxID=172846 RepID=A0AAV4Y7Y3_CAEEX|nr:hypothetical protein CEXT_213771 [Caerostris extrusa]
MNCRKALALALDLFCPLKTSPSPFPKVLYCCTIQIFSRPLSGILIPLTLHRETLSEYQTISRNTVEIRYTPILACKEGRQLEPALPPLHQQSEKQENRLIIRVHPLHPLPHRTQVSVVPLPPTFLSEGRRNCSNRNKEIS